MRFALIAHKLSSTNVELVARGWPDADSMLLEPQAALRQLRRGDVALNRLDVLPTLNGVEEGLWIVGQLEANGVRVLESGGLPHPRTARLTRTRDAAGFHYPVVAKPRFGSWGRDVVICADASELARYLAASLTKSWGRAGAIVQEFIHHAEGDLRLVVAGGQVVGSASRRPRAREWRTNVALGAAIEPTSPDPLACEIAVSAARTLALDLAGIDLAPTDDGYVVIEVNGAVEFRPLYSQRDVFAAAMAGLARRHLLVAS